MYGINYNTIGWCATKCDTMFWSRLPFIAWSITKYGAIAWFSSKCNTRPGYDTTGKNILARHDGNNFADADTELSKDQLLTNNGQLFQNSLIFYKSKFRISVVGCHLTKLFASSHTCHKFHCVCIYSIKLFTHSHKYILFTFGLLVLIANEPACTLQFDLHFCSMISA